MRVMKSMRKFGCHCPDAITQFEILFAGRPEFEQNTVCKSSYLVEIGIDCLAKNKASRDCSFPVLAKSALLQTALIIGDWK